MYQVWTKGDEYSGWTRKDCDDLAAAQAEIMAALKKGTEPLLTVDVPFNVNIEIKEVKVSEANTRETNRDKNTRAEGEGEVRSGTTDSVSELS